MKRILACLFALAVAATAANVTLEWDPCDPAQGVVEYRLYEQVGEGWVQVGSVPATETTITLTNVAVGPHTWVATAVNSAALESGHSNEASTTVLAPLQPPAGLRVTVVVTVDIQP